jgi:hypothetical protein
MIIRGKAAAGVFSEIGRKGRGLAVFQISNSLKSWVVPTASMVFFYQLCFCPKSYYTKEQNTHERIQKIETSCRPHR